jgi:hypothetical protein
MSMTENCREVRFDHSGLSALVGGESATQGRRSRKRITS